ncbi:MAG: hypothetical protein K2X27_27980 [Candidatus Obscuribacterales bacterium]|nr:hypothetical protein [Candidatus Obscuribacterales bacterium]
MKTSETQIPRFSGENPNPNSSSGKAPARKGKLEDLLNDIMSFEASSSLSSARPSASSTAARQNYPSHPAVGHNQAPGKEADAILPLEIRSELRLPASPEGTFQFLKCFYQNNRHKPFMRLMNGRVFYVDYNLEMDLVRVFVGSDRHFASIAIGARESTAFFQVDELFEYKLENSNSDFLGIKRNRERVLHKRRSGRDLLSLAESANLKLLPFLHFTHFNEKNAGTASFTVKAESLS